jgi:serine/threonine-protein kinase RsbT
MMTPPASSLVIEGELEARFLTDAAVAQTLARRLAARCGFGNRAQAEIATAVSEAVTNMVKFAGGGHLVVRYLPTPTPRLSFEAIDNGPGIPDLEAALRDGFSEGHQITPDTFSPHRRGQGSGLPAIARLMDFLSLQPRPGGGTILTASKLLDR